MTLSNETLLDHEKLPAWLAEAACEIRMAHSILNNRGIPLCSEGGTPYTLAARVALLAYPDEDDSSPVAPEEAAAWASG